MKIERPRIRRAGKNDEIKIIELLAQLDRPIPKNLYTERKFRRIMKMYTHSNHPKYDRGVFVATVGSRIIGMISFVILDRLNQSRSEFWIPELVVSEEFRNQGVGKLLVEKCESIARTQKCYRIRLESRSDRTSAHSFYAKIGFRQVALAFEKKLRTKRTLKFESKKAA